MATTRYNYQLDIANSANDYYFEQNPNSNTAYPDVSQFNTQAAADEASDTKTIATVPLIGYTTKRQKACSYSIAKIWCPRRPSTHTGPTAATA